MKRSISLKTGVINESSNARRSKFREEKFPFFIYQTLVATEQTKLECLATGYVILCTWKSKRGQVLGPSLKSNIIKSALEYKNSFNISKDFKVQMLKKNAFF